MIYCILVSHKAMQMQEEGAHTFPTYKALLNAVVAELYDHKWFYAAFMPENWENQLSAYYYEGAFNCDTVDLIIYALTSLTEKACKVITVASDGKVAFIHDITPNREEKKCLLSGLMFMLKDLHYEPLVKIVSESIFFRE